MMAYSSLEDVVDVEVVVDIFKDDEFDRGLEVTAMDAGILM